MVLKHSLKIRITENSRIISDGKRLINRTKHRYKYLNAFQLYNDEDEKTVRHDSDFQIHTHHNIILYKYFPTHTSCDAICKS